MSINFNGTTVSTIDFNSTDLTSVDFNGTEVWTSGPPPEYTGLCFTANTAGSTVELTIIGSPPIRDTAYSRDGITWTTFTPSESRGTNIITLSNVGDKVYFRNKISSNRFSAGAYWKFIMSGSIAASGNINSMYKIDNFDELTTLSYDYCYAHLFEDCTALTTAPELPATSLSKYCYSYMFAGCTALTTVPELPATSIINFCYSYMFAGCTALTTVPELIVKAIKSSCYNHMFFGCTSLYVSDTQTAEAQYAWKLPLSGTFSATYAQSGMFTGCLGTRANDNMPGGLAMSYTYYTQNAPV